MILLKNSIENLESIFHIIQQHSFNSGFTKLMDKNFPVNNPFDDEKNNGTL